MSDVIHRLKAEQLSYGLGRRYAICGAVEDGRRHERLNFTIAAEDVTCEPCQPIDTGSVCPARERWWHRKPRPHEVSLWRSIDIGNCRRGACRHCGRSMQQRLSYGGTPIGPPIDEVWLPCDHGVGGVPTQACMRCATDRSRRGLHQ